MKFETPQASSPFPEQHLRKVMEGKLPVTPEKRAPGTRTPMTTAELERHYKDKPEILAKLLERRKMEEDLARLNQELNEDLAKLSSEEPA